MHLNWLFLIWRYFIFNFSADKNVCFAFSINHLIDNARLMKSWANSYRVDRKYKEWQGMTGFTNTVAAR